MENPASWKRTELIIDRAITEHRYMTSRGAIGPSLAHLIAQRLRAASAVHDDQLPEVGWDRLRRHLAETEEMFPANGDIERWENEGGAVPQSGRLRAAPRPVAPRGHDGGAEPGRSPQDHADEHDDQA